ncbi:hypothetical protein GQ600_13719 [Phytophthora cactorum]|nr:hypothetical protein GQ600_13719 [Phytophthora cactorum]
MSVISQEITTIINAIKMTHESNEMINALKHLYSHLFMCNNLATDIFPQHSSCPPMIKDKLALDGNPSMNLASFVTTYMA